jgi:hypothetical protein
MTKTETDALLADPRSRRLAQENAARTEQANAAAKYRAQSAADRRDLTETFEKLDRMFADIQHRLDVIEKSRAALSIQPPRRELTSWSPEGLAAALRDMPPAELAKLLQ